MKQMGEMGVLEKKKKKSIPRRPSFERGGGRRLTGKEMMSDVLRQ